MGREKNRRIERQNARRLQALEAEALAAQALAAQALAAEQAERIRLAAEAMAAEEEAMRPGVLEARGRIVGERIAGDIAKELLRQASRWGTPRDFADVDLDAVHSEERRLQRALMEIPEVDPDGPAWESAAERFYDGIMQGLKRGRTEWMAAADQRRLEEISRLVAESAKDGAPRKRSRKEELQIAARSA
jgi:hypothetical protein